MDASKPTPIEVDDAIVLILGAPSDAPALQGRVEGITRLEKLVFLLERESEIGSLLTEDPAYRADNFGPFSVKVYQAVETLAAADLIKDSAELSQSTEDAWETSQIVGTETDPYSTRNFTLTARGERYYRALIRELPRDAEALLAQFKTRFAPLPLRQLIRYVYTKYPDFTHKSLIKGDILQ